MDVLFAQNDHEMGMGAHNAFDAVSKGNWDDLSAWNADKLKPYLPYIVGIAVNSDTFKILRNLHQLPEINTVLGYLRLDFTMLAEFIKEEKAQKLVSKDLSFIASVGDQLTFQFETGSPLIRAKIVLSELFTLSECSQISLASDDQLKIYESDICGNEIYTPDLCLLVPILLAKCPHLSPKDIIEGLLCVKSSSGIIVSIVCNCPLLFEQIVETLLQCASKCEVVREILLEICQLSPLNALRIRRILLERGIDAEAEIALSITLSSLNDEADFLSNVFNTNYMWLRNWIITAQKVDAKGQGTEHPTVTAVVSKLTASLQKWQSNKPNVSAMECNILVRVWCGLTGLTALKLRTADLDLLMNFFISFQDVHGVSKLGLCFMLTYRDLTKICGQDKILECLHSFAKQQECYDVMLLLAINFQTNQISSITDLIRSMLNYPVSIHIESLVSVGELFTQHVFQDATVAKGALSIPITPQLSSADSAVGLTCIYHLLKGKMFYSSHSIELTTWIFSQIKQVAEPLHPLIRPMVEEFTACCISSSSVDKISPKEIREAIPNLFVPAQIVLAYFCLFFNDQLLKKVIDDKSKNYHQAYGREVMDLFPFKALLSYIETHSKLYANLHPAFLSLLVNQYPQLFNAANLLYEEQMKTRISTEAHQPTKSLDTKVIEKAFENAVSNPMDTLFVLRDLANLDVKKLWDHTNSLLDLLVPHLMDHRIEHGILSAFKVVWDILFTNYPWELSIKMINLLKASKASILGVHDPLLSHSSLINDPLLLFKVKPQIFRIPILFSIFLQILNGYIIASRKELSVQAQILQKHEEMGTLTLAQESAIVHQLLEICKLNQKEDEQGNGEEIRVQICEFLHDMFIENPLLIKLVHFQGYDVKLLKLTVPGIPSMHICLDFIPELLAQQQVEKQIFGVKLGSTLVEQYPLARSLDIARVILNHMRFHVNDLENYLPTSRADKTKASFLIETLPCVVQLCGVFPALTQDAVKLLIDLSPTNGFGSSYANVKSPKLVEVVQETFGILTKKFLTTD